MVLSLFVLVVGCSGNHDEITPFCEYQVDEVNKIDMSTVRKKEVRVEFDDGKNGVTKIAFFGLKSNRIWFAIFDKTTKELIVEYSFESEIPQKINLPYGEQFEVVDWSLDFYECGNLIVTDGSYSKVKLENGSINSSDSSCSFTAPIFVNKEFVSLVNGLVYPYWNGDSHIFNVNNGFLLIKNDGSSLLLKDSPYVGSDYIHTPITYTLTFHNTLSIINIHDLVQGNRMDIDIVELKDMVANSETDWGHIMFVPQSVTDENYVEIICTVTFRTGKKARFEIKICMLDGSYLWKEL